MARESPLDGPAGKSPNFDSLLNHDELLARDKVDLDLSGWVTDDSAEEAESLQTPEDIAAEIVEDLRSALTEFAAVADALGGRRGSEE